MTRYHYIKKCMYLQYRLLMLPNAIHRTYDTSYAKWNSLVSQPPFLGGAQTYQEEWDSLCEFIRESVEGLEDLE